MPIAPDAARPWIRTLQSGASLRLLCLPHAGGGTVDYRPWQALFPDTIDVCPIVLPGRESRMSERPLDTIRGVADAMVRDMRGVFTDAPYAIYGHSMGAWVGFELCRALRRAGLPDPLHLYISARRAPHLPSSQSKIYHLPDAGLVRAIQERYNAIPQQLIDQPEILQLFLPVLRADFTALDTYPYVPGPPLNVPVWAMRGAGDTVVGDAVLAAWRQHTSADFKTRLFPGGHFFLREDRELLCDALCTSLLRYLRAIH